MNSTLGQSVPDEDWDYVNQTWGWQCSDPMQAPINLNSPYTSQVNISEDDLTFDYNEVDDAYISHTGNNLILTGDFGSVRFMGMDYYASQMVFYRYSEHSFGPDLVHSDLELQITHRGTDESRLVIVVNYDNSTSNSMFMEELDFEQIRGIHSGDSRRFDNLIDPGLIFNNVTQFLLYRGSLTRPPCTPNVQYIVLTSIKRITSEGLNSFPIDLEGMTRETQDREDRSITIYNYAVGVYVNVTSDGISDSEYNQIQDDQVSSNITVQGFRLNSDTQVPTTTSTPYPIVAPIHAHLPFSAMNPSMLNAPPDTQENIDHSVDVAMNVVQDKAAEHNQLTSNPTATARPQSPAEPSPSSRQGQQNAEFQEQIARQERQAHVQQEQVGTTQEDIESQSFEGHQEPQTLDDNLPEEEDQENENSENEENNEEDEDSEQEEESGTSESNSEDNQESAQEQEATSNLPEPETLDSHQSNHIQQSPSDTITNNNNIVFRRQS